MHFVFVFHKACTIQCFICFQWDPELTKSLHLTNAKKWDKEIRQYEVCLLGMFPLAQGSSSISDNSKQEG